MTYSIVARDPGTGELGVAVQSHWFSVGPIVPWAAPRRRRGRHAGQRRGRVRAAGPAPARRRARRPGGDLRGRQSAAILVVPAAGDPWETVISLRVEDDPDPLGELARLMTLHAAYALAGEADEHLAAGRSAQAAALYARVCEIAPGCDELRFWAGLAAAQTGDLDHAVALVAAAIDVHPGWRELLARLPPDIAPAALVARLR